MKNYRIEYNESVYNKESIKIGLVGGIRTGKDTVAGLLVQRLPKYTERVAFATGIKAIVADYLPDLYYKGKPRKAFQVIGQTLRQFDPDVWINDLLSRVSAIENEGINNFIVTDVRQPNEAKKLADEGYLLIKVTADTKTRIERAMLRGDVFDEEDFEHETEHAVNYSLYHVEIENNGTLKELKESVDNVIKTYFEEVTESERAN